MASCCPARLCNIPILLVVKPKREHRVIQDLKVVNDAVVTVHPLMANPYSILTQISEDAKLFTVLNLKDAFFCIPVRFSSQYLFAFNWTNTDLGQMQQYTWTVLPQRFQDSPHMFAQTLGKELRETQLKRGVILQ